MSSRSWTVVMTAIVLTCLSATLAAAWDKDATRAAAKRVSEELAGTTFRAKIALGAAQHYYVLPDGTPVDKKGKPQGKGGASKTTLWVPGGKIKVAEGGTGRSIYVWAKKKEIRVGLHDKPDAVLNAAIVHILFDRETTPADYDANRIAEALVSLVEIDGYEPGAAIAEAFDEAIDRSAEAEAAAPATVPATPSGPTVLKLQAIAEPTAVSRGGEVRLILAYELTGPRSGVAVTESRTLRLGDQAMPNFPIVDEVTEGPGPVRSTYRQPLPASIAPGTYTFEGRVCVGADCIQRSVTFDVR